MNLRIICVLFSVLAFCFVIAAPQCATEEMIQITKPTETNDVATLPPNAEVAFKLFVPFRWKGLLNGGSVAQLFSPTPNKTAVVNGNDLLPYLLEGANTFRVIYGGDTDDVVFLYDGFGPSVRISTLNDNGSTLSLWGSASDFSGVNQIKVNGVLANLSDNNFNVSVPSSDLLTFFSEDKLGNTQEETYAASNTFLPESAGARVTSAGFDQLALKLTELLGEQVDLEALLIALNPIFQQTIPNPNGGVPLATAQVNVNSLTFDNFTLTPTLIPTQKMSWLTSYHNVTIGMTASGTTLGVPYTSPVTARMDRLDALVDVTVQVVSQQIQIVVNSVNIDFVNFVIDFGTLPPAFQQGLGAAITSALDSELTSALETVLPTILTALLESLTLGGTVTINGAVLSFSAQPHRLTISDDAMNLYLGGDVNPNEFGSDIPFFPGSDYTASEAPSMDFVTTPNKMGVTMSDDMLNRLLFAGFQTGKITSEVETSLQDVAANVTPLEVLFNKEQEVKDIPIRAIPHLSKQPLLSFGSTIQDKVIFVVSNLRTEFLMFEATPGSWRSIVMIDINLKVEVNFQATPEGKLNVSFAERPVVTFQIVEDSFLRPTENIDTNALLEAIIPLLLEEFGKSMEEIPIPSFEDYEFLVDTIRLDGASKDYVTLVGNIVERTE